MPARINVTLRTISLGAQRSRLSASCCFSQSAQSASHACMRFASKMLFRGLIAHWLLAESPMTHSVSVTTTQDGVMVW
jgi:hypothetical protein